MKNKDIIACGASLYRVLNVADGTMFVMDCLNPKMPFWTSGVEDDCKYVTEQELYERTGKVNTALDDLDAVRRRVALNRYFIFGHSPNTTGCAQVRFLLACQPCNCYLLPIIGSRGSNILN